MTVKALGKIGLVFGGLLLVGGAVGGKMYWSSLVARAEANQLDASRALMKSEELVWTLEGECLKDAQRILAMPDAKLIATVSETASAEEKARAESRLRQFLRIRRDPEIWKQTKEAFATMTEASRAAMNDAAIKAGLRPVDIISEWMTFEGASDLALMTNVYENRDKLRSQHGPLLDTFFPANAEAPSVTKGVKVIEHQDDRIVIDLFGGHVVEEWVKGERVQISGDGTAKIKWKSNYNFLRDAAAPGGKPEAIQEETLVRSDDGFGVEYRALIKEYLEGGDTVPWACVLCLKGPMAVAALKPEKSEKDEKAPEKGEKAPEKGEKHD